MVLRCDFAVQSSDYLARVKGLKVAVFMLGQHTLGFLGLFDSRLGPFHLTFLLVGHVSPCWST